ncbi:hypothetical protein MAR_030674 [Mya arenaria]|uniref:Uncharacterized protein n=1 Tax=Mya arenaria TaxID=6604 RepID=A0ABY7F1M4_MYAAR|nr:hypothetical protein MAR_030674 [Mya arenaria]
MGINMNLCACVVLFVTVSITTVYCDVILCEGSTGYIECPFPSRIVIYAASYGRTRLDVCPDSNIYTLRCRARGTLRRLGARTVTNADAVELHVALTTQEKTSVLPAASKDVTRTVACADAIHTSRETTAIIVPLVDMAKIVSTPAPVDVQMYAIQPQGLVAAQLSLKDQGATFVWMGNMGTYVLMTAQSSAVDV